jgi:hypothetical protein
MRATCPAHLILLDLIHKQYSVKNTGTFWKKRFYCRVTTTFLLVSIVFFMFSESENRCFPSQSEDKIFSRVINTFLCLRKSDWQCITVFGAGIECELIVKQIFSFNGKKLASTGISTLENSTVQNGSRDSSVGIALGYGLDDRGSRVRFPVGAGNFYLHHRVQNGSAAHPASYPMCTRGSFSGGKAAGARSWPLTSI